MSLCKTILPAGWTTSFRLEAARLGQGAAGLEPKNKEGIVDGQLSIQDELGRQAREAAVAEMKRIRYDVLRGLLVERGHEPSNAADIAWGTVYGLASNLDV